VTVGYTDGRMSALLRRYVPMLILLLALVLRLWGIAWGLPDGSHAFSYHPDESMVVGKALLQPGQNILDTGFYNYGSLATLTDRFLLLATGQASNPIPTASALLLARLVTVLYGVGTCALLLQLGKRLALPGVGYSAATLYALSPLAVQHGHFATVDVPATFWVTACLLCALTSPHGTSPHGDSAVTPSGKRRGKEVLLCGLFAGLAAATKYNAGLVLLAGVAATLLPLRPNNGEPESPIIGGRRAVPPGGGGRLIGGAVVGFLLGCPGVLVNFPQFWQDFTFELAHARRTEEYFLQNPSGFVYWPFLGFPFGLGFPLSLLALVYLLWPFWGLLEKPRRFFVLNEHTRPLLVLSAFAWPYLLLLCLSANQYERYLIPLLPALCFLLSYIHHNHFGLRILVGLSALVPLAMSLGLSSVMAGPDPRDEALAFLKQKGVSSVGFARGPWFWSPPLHPGLSSPAPPMAKRAAESSETIRLFAVPDGQDWDVSLLDQNPDAVALSEIEYSAALAQKNPKALAFLEAVTARYPTKTVFSHPLPVLGGKPLQGLPCQSLPIDMIYPNQSVVVFTK